MLKIVDQGIISREPGRGAYMPVITPLADGKNWANQGSIHTESHGLDAWTFRGPIISSAPDGRLVMTASRFENKESLFDVESEASALGDLALFWSEDNGRTWSAPQIVPVDLPRDRYNWNGAGTLLQLASDRWMYPLETWKPDGYEGPPDQKAAAVFSSDQGKTWGEFTVVADDPSGKTL